jgi:hypothetical protein
MVLLKPSVEVGMLLEVPEGLGTDDADKEAKGFVVGVAIGDFLESTNVLGERVAQVEQFWSACWSAVSSSLRNGLMGKEEEVLAG